MNRKADRHFPYERINALLNEFAQRLDIRDSAGRLVDFNRTHRFRHTKATSQLIDERRQAFKARTGQEMSPDNVWLAGRLQEQDALGRIIIRIEQTRLADGSVHAVRGAGVAARTDAITAEMDGSHHGAR